MEAKRILVVDDEQDLCDILLFNLRAAGYEAEAAYSAEEALKRLEAGPPPALPQGRGDEDESNGSPTPPAGGLRGAFPPFDLLLLDVMMPGMSGFELARLLKADERTASMPIIFLTAKDAEEDVLHGFGLGADDYVSKPFSLREVLARVKAVLNRKPSSAPAPKAELQFEGLVVNVINKTICIDGQPVAVTRTEFELLKLLLEYRGQVFSRQQLLDSVWPKDVIVTERTVDVNVARLRKKLGRYGACLVSRTGFGYMFDVSKPLTLFS
ncbi:MAG: response regulator transcription factor [Prevotella sp.]|nr:response regulator transcription factor [Prevotella sp.]